MVGRRAYPPGLGPRLAEVAGDHRLRSVRGLMSWQLVVRHCLLRQADRRNGARRQGGVEREALWNRASIIGHHVTERILLGGNSYHRVLRQALRETNL